MPLALPLCTSYGMALSSEAHHDITMRSLSHDQPQLTLTIDHECTITNDSKISIISIISIIVYFLSIIPVIGSSCGIMWCSCNVDCSHAAYSKSRSTLSSVQLFVMKMRFLENDRQVALHNSLNTGLEKRDISERYGKDKQTVFCQFALQAVPSATVSNSKNKHYHQSFS